MTRANAELLKHTPWFAKAGAACSIVPISRFVGENFFALKGGGYGCLFSLTGLDEEGLTDLELESRVRSIEGSLRGLPQGSCLFQYTRVMSGFDLPRQKTYANQVTENFATDRLSFLQKNASFRRIDLHWCLTLEPSKVKALERKPTENAVDTSRMLSDLEKTATLLAGHLGSSLGLKLLGKNEAFQFFSYLFNLEEWAGQDQLRSDTGVDRQIVKSPVAWHSDHVQIGNRHMQMFSLKTTPEASRPCLFSALLTLDCDSVLCTTWRVKSASSARSEIDAQEKFISFFKVGVLTRVMSGRDAASLDTGAGAKAANNSVDDLSDVIRSLDKKAQGEFSLRLLIATRSPEQLRQCAPAVHRVFVDSRAQVMEETLGNLSAFYAMFPGNHKFNVFPMWLSEEHHARLSSVFAPQIGHPHSEDLDSEYLNIFETRTRTPFFQDVYVDGVRVMLILGPTGTGKTSTLAAIREGAEQGGYKVEGFAPTSKAAGQLRVAGIEANTLQSFLARQKEADPSRHLYMLDESSLASTRQMRAFLEKIRPEDRVLVIGDTRQHQGVDAGRPFQQMQEAGMQTSKLNTIMRQKDPELLRAVQYLATNQTEKGIALLSQQGRVTELAGAPERIAAIARDYAAKSENTLIVSPDNRSRQQINEAVRVELLRAGMLAEDGRHFLTLSHRSVMTGPDRTWAAMYRPGDVVQYERGSKAEGIERGSFAVVRTNNAATNRLTVELRNGSTVEYDPKRVYGVNVYRETSREFATGDRLQFSGIHKDLGVANRDMGTITKMEPDRLTVLMDGKERRSISFNPTEFRQFDHGYAVTSHSAQGLTTGRVIANIDTESSRSLINNRLAYVAISRASEDARIYTNDAATLGQRLATDVTKTAALDFISKLDQPINQEVPRARAVAVHEYTNRESRLAAVANEYASRPERSVIIAPDRAERADLTQLVRDELYAHGKLGRDAQTIAVLVKNETGSKMRVESYQPGDKIQYETGSPGLHGIPHNSQATVLSTTSRGNLLSVRFDATREEVSYNPAQLRTLTRESHVYREETREIAEGERIRFGRYDKNVGIRSGELGTVGRIGLDHSMTVKMDSATTVEISAEKARHIDYGYAVGGLTNVRAERILATGDGFAHKNLQGTSPKANLSLYTNSPQQVSSLTKEIAAPGIAQPAKQQRDFGIGS